MRSVIYGTAVVVHDGFDVDRVAESLEGDGVTLISVVATQLIRLLEAEVDLLPLRAVLVGGGPVPEDVLEEALGARGHRGPDLRAHRGGLAGDDALAGRRAPRLGSAGRSLLTTHLRIQEGEILVQGPTVAPGVADEDGWLHTGDLGRIDDDGFLYVTGRLGDVIVSGGENVLPSEVEAVLQAPSGGRRRRRRRSRRPRVAGGGHGRRRAPRRTGAERRRPAGPLRLGARRPQGPEAVRVRLRAAPDRIGQALAPGAALIEREAVDRWLDAYVRAWKSYDRDEIAALFSADVVYRYHPYDEPIEGREAVVDSWLGEGDRTTPRPATPRAPTRASYRAVAVDGDVAVAVGTSSYAEVPAGPMTRVFDNCFVIRFDADGLCREFTEWFVERPDP